MKLVASKDESQRKDRFDFGTNWQRHLADLTDDRISHARQPLVHRLEPAHLVGNRFVDIGCGSGLFTLAARTPRNYHEVRGMSLEVYPFEVAKPEQIFELFYSRGFFLDRLRTVGGGIACNEHVFKRRG